MAPGKRFFAYPVLGTVRAGVPQPASDEAFEFLSVEELLVREPNRTAMRHVRGDSMKDAVGRARSMSWPPLMSRLDLPGPTWHTLSRV